MTTQIKICGLTNTEDALAALDSGADYLGFVMYTGSPRANTAQSLQQIRATLPSDARVVAVFVNETPEEVARIASACDLAAVQIHGDEASAGFQSMPVPVWRAVHRRQEAWQPAPADWPAERYVVDAAPAGQYGGSGIESDFEAAASLARQNPLMLAGGLRPDNVTEAVKLVRPLGVDVTSGVESEPGRKDHGRIRDFIRNVKTADMEILP
ncbi:MAG: phosphoribosylanthranilate isomerase [Verrucomicrobia bacterium]|nr:phosphoribosylanthranilate isomerase [Verrucomicrobiota bacterium]MDA1087033.1 phosphoribosylanthranilate isomerase [Verrucomicrobiota bacterium]